MTLIQLAALYQAKGAGEKAIDDLEVALRGGDPVAAHAAVQRLEQAAGTAWLATRGPLWWAASGLPAVGDDIRAVRTSAEVAEALTGPPLDRMVTAAEELSGIAAAGGRIDVDALERSDTAVRDAQQALDAQLALLDAIDSEALGRSVRGSVNDLASALSEAAANLDQVADVTEVLPAVLGADGPRTYLVLVQNNAEVRATGGMPGAIAVLSVEDGHVRLRHQGGARVLGAPLGTPVVPLTDDELALFGTQLASYPADITFTPDFPRTAELAQALYERRTGEAVDGVFATDPVALSYLLHGGGPLVVDGERLRAGEVVDQLLNGVYLENPTRAAQDAVFREVAQSVFNRLTSAKVGVDDLVAAFSLATKRGRLLAWSAHDQEQAVIATTGLSGILPVEATERPAVGVYLNDGTGAKLGYYLDRDIAVTSVGCDDGVQTLEVVVTLRSSVPAQLPPTVIGPGFGAPAGVIRTNVLTYAPIGGAVLESTLDGAPVTLPALSHHERAVAAVTIDLSPGEVVTLANTLISGPAQPARPDVDVTPGLGGDSLRVDGSC